jgi:DUF218 domain
MFMPLNVLRSALFAAFALAFSYSACAQVAIRPLPIHSPVQEKNFYFFSVLQEGFQLRHVLSADPALAGIAAERDRSLTRSLMSCKEDAICALKSLLWTDEEIHAVSLALADLYRRNLTLRQQVDGRLRTSGAYVLYEKQGDTELLMAAWEICARGVNDILSVYGAGEAPRYPLIDSVSFDVHSTEFQQRLGTLIRRAAAPVSPSKMFFESSLNAALELLAMNHRDEAGRLEPMEAGVNFAAVSAVHTTVWGKYSYSVIVVPGEGPDDPNTPLSNAGRRRTALAAEAYHAGKAPFILVSGGFVHPAQTRFSEALEMKRALLQDFNVPEAVVLVDPHARHTTTNMRNAAREIYRYGIPMNKPALVVSDAAQLAYIAGQPFADRCLKELGYMPFRILSRTSDTQLVFQPEIESLEQDPMDPLDP